MTKVPADQPKVGKSRKSHLNNLLTFLFVDKLILLCPQLPNRTFKLNLLQYSCNANSLEHSIGSNFGGGREGLQIYNITNNNSNLDPVFLI